MNILGVDVSVNQPRDLPILIADWSMYQAIYHGDPHNLDQLYDPAYWTVTIDWDKVKAACAGVIIRVGIGTRKDPCFDRFLAGIRAAGIPWGIYHAYDPWADPVHQAQLVRQWCAVEPPLGVWADVEMGNAIIALTLVYLAALDDQFTATIGLYSGGPYLDAHFTPAQQDALTVRPLWIAGYPNYWPPYAWNKGASHALHQYTDRYSLPGLPKPCDMSVPGPAWPYGSLPMTNLQPGAGYGVSAEQPGRIIPILDAYKAAGVMVRGITAIENPGLARDAHDRGVRDCVARFKNRAGPDGGERWENGQNADTWTDDEIGADAKASIQQVFDRSNPWERAGITHWIPGINEFNPDTFNTGNKTPEASANWTAIGKLCLALCREAGRRDQEYFDSCGQHLRLVLPNCPQGAPQYWQMQQFLATGAGDVMASRGDLFGVHEGPFPWQDGPQTGQGDLIPGAPYCPPRGGSGTGRIHYWILAGLKCDFITTECYDGLGLDGDPLERLRRMRLIEAIYRISPQYRATTYYMLAPDPNSRWHATDFTPVFDVAHDGQPAGPMLAELLAQKDTPNPTGEIPMPFYTDAQVAAIAHKMTEVLAILDAGHTYKAGDVVNATVDPINLYGAAGGSVVATRPHYQTTDQTVLAVSPDSLWLKVFASPEYWVRAVDVKLKGT